MLRTTVIALALALSWTSGPIASSTAQSSGRTPAAPAVWLDVYDPFVLRRMNIEISDVDYATIQGDENFEIEVPAVFWLEGDVGGARYQISIRRKSATAIGEKISYRFKIVAQQGLPTVTTWHGIRTLSLENGDDQDVVSEGLAWYLHRLASTTSPTYVPSMAAWTLLTMHVVSVGGTDVRPQGVYLNVEFPDKRFLQRRGIWVDDATWLYKQDDIGPAEMKESPGAADSPAVGVLTYKPFLAGNQVPEPPDDDSLHTQLSEWIDMDSMLRLGAVNAFTDNPDELWNKGKNFYWIDYAAHVPNKRRQYIPWDLDAAIRSTDANIYASSQGQGVHQHPYQSILLNHGLFRAQFNQIMLALLDGPMAVAPILAALDRIEAEIGAALEADPNSKIRDASAHFGSLRSWIVLRDASVRARVVQNGPPPPRK